MKMDMKYEPSNKINESARNPYGQADTMKGTTQNFTPTLLPPPVPNQAFDPTGSMGCKLFEKKM